MSVHMYILMLKIPIQSATLYIAMLLQLKYSLFIEGREFTDPQNDKVYNSNQRLLSYDTRANEYSDSIQLDKQNYYDYWR